MYYGSTYHLFTQYNPFGATWGHMSWSHSASLDLVHWWHLPVALWPNQTYDKSGVFSGSATIVDGKPVIAYTCVGPKGQLQCLARPVDASDPDLVEWVKDEANPVIATPPPGVPAGSFRDPTTAWRSGPVWRMAVGSSVDGHGRVAQYSTPDFENWSFVGDMYADASGSHGMFECPDFYSAGDGSGNSTWVMKISSDGDWYALGDYDEEAQSFAPRTPLRKYVEGSFYASKRFYDGPRARQTLFGWAQETSPTTVKRGWQGAQTLPLGVTYVPASDVLAVYPIPELSALRNQTQVDNNTPIVVAPGGDVPVSAAAGLMLEVHARFRLPAAEACPWRRCLHSRWARAAAVDEEACAPAADPGAATSYGVAVRASADGSVQTRVGVAHVPTTGPLNNTDMPGGDYRDFGLPASAGAEANIANCSRTCLLEPECAAWTYVREGGPKDGLSVPRCSLKSSTEPTDTNQWCVSGTVASMQLVVNQSRAGGDGKAVTYSQSVPVTPDDTEAVISVWVDHSVLHSFYNAGTGRIVSRSYPDGSADGVRLFASGSNASATVDSLQVYGLESIWIPGRPAQ